MRRDVNWLLWEVKRLGAGGEMNETLATRLTSQERVTFEIALIDALSNGTVEQRRRLRRALIRYGYDEQCSRRVMREAVADRVRAATILVLLHPRAKKASERSRAAGKSE